MSQVQASRRHTTGRALITCAAAVSAVLAGAALPTFSSTAATVTDASRRVQFDIAAQSLATALQRYSEQAKVQVTAPSELVHAVHVQALQGEYDAVQALQRMLDGTGLSFQFVNEGSVAIRVAAGEAASGGAETVSSRSDDVEQGSGFQNAFRMAQTQTDTASAADSQAAGPRGIRGGVDKAVAGGEMIGRLEEVVVTGSHIRGVQNLSSPIIRFDRAEIERSGYATTQELLQSLPQNLNNISDTTVGSVTGGQDWEISYDGAGVNLRGLGGDATLVLLNGRRLAAAGNGSFVDVSLIPLSAVEHVEVLTDGASAIYGSDAVGGVVNMTLRKDFAGAETRLRYGSVTEGSHDELQAGQMLGHAWNSGQVLLGYEYYRRTELDGLEREFFQPSVFRNLIFIPNQKRHGALAVVSQRLTDNVELSSDLFYGERQSTSGYDFGFLQSDILSDATQYGGSLGLNVDMSGDWQARLSGIFDQSKSDLKYVTPTTGTVTSRTGNQSRVRSVDFTADGSIMQAPGGRIRLAIGGQFRFEDFTEKSIAYPAQLERDVTAAYAEVLTPLVGAQNRLPGIERLELTVASRFEEYSDFGSTFNPKAGVAWAPVNGLNVRSTFGTSFKAPLLSQMNPGNVRASVNQNRFRQGVETLTGVSLFGNGENLGPEESTNWTLGFDFAPQDLDDLSLSATYFAIDYENRIRAPFPSGYDIYGVLMDPLFTMVVDRHPSPEQLAGRLVHPNTTCSTAEGAPCASMPSAEEINVIVDGRLRNLAGVRMSGIDFASTYDLPSRIGDWRFQLSGTYLLKNREQLVPGSEESDELNNVWRPVDLRLRGGASFTRGPLSANAFVNYTDGYRDLRTSLVDSSTQRSTVASWTTVDLTLQYELGQMLASRWLGETTLTLSGVNVFDRAPPYIANFYGVFYDGVNANPRGRFISAQLIARW